MARELISPRTRTEFREHLVGFTLREITDEFDAARITCNTSYSPPFSGARRCLVEQYYHTLNFTDPCDVRKLLDVYENVLAVTMNRQPMYGHSPEKMKEENQAKVNGLVAWLRKDGYDFIDHRIFPAGGPALGAMKVKAVEYNAEYLAQQITRMEGALDADPAHAIGVAKELIETCCRTILGDRGKPVTDKPDVLPLVRRTMEELSLVPEGIPDEAKGAKTIKALLGNLATVAQSLAELRNLYGTGHGKDGRAKGLLARHARLAVGSATTLSVFLFDTHQDRSGA